MSHLCPVCNRPVYARRKKRCGYCDGVLPDEALLSSEESEAVASSIQDIETRRRLKKEKEEERKAKEAADSAAVFPPRFF